MDHAFISYVRENSEVVDRLALELRTLGINIWLDRDQIEPGTWWKDAINEAIHKGAFFIACFSKEFNDREEAYMHGELRLAIDRLRNMPRKRIWFIPVMINKTNIPSHPISDHESLRDIQVISLFENWDDGILKILQVIKRDDPDYMHLFYLIDTIKFHPSVRRRAIEQLKGVRAGTRLAVPALIEALRDPDQGVRGQAAAIPEFSHSLGGMRHDQDMVIADPAVFRVTNEPLCDKRSNAYITLFDLGVICYNTVVHDRK